jgi:hypothetical protein
VRIIFLHHINKYGKIRRKLKYARNVIRSIKMDWFKVHKDYDKITEPWRMLIALYFMSPFFLGLAFMDYNYNWVIGVIAGCLIGIYRILYFMKYDKRGK